LEAALKPRKITATSELEPPGDCYPDFSGSFVEVAATDVAFGHQPSIRCRRYVMISVGSFPVVTETKLRPGSALLILLG
jgi:hypothetical protein